MNNLHAHAAFGAPRIEPRWTSSAKERLGTAYHTSCRIWFTLSHGIVNEIYFTTVDQPNTRDFQFLISDGETFFHEEKRDLEYRIDYLDRDFLSYRLSRCILLAHEDKLFQGALVASMSIPWGETKDDRDVGGYHLVWTRDLVQSATALLATGQTGTPLRALIWLAAIQREDGRFPQNSWIDGTAFWNRVQLNEIAAPILLAWRLQREGVSLGNFDPSVMIFRAAAYLIRQGPVTDQERWEESPGYSPSTLATVIAGLVCAAEWAGQHHEAAAADFILQYADWLVAHVEDWTVTTAGDLVAGSPRHYIRKHDHKLFRMRGTHLSKELTHSLRIHLVANHPVQLTFHGTDRSIYIGELPLVSVVHHGAHRGGSPAPANLDHPAKTSFILKGQPHFASFGNFWLEQGCQFFREFFSKPPGQRDHFWGAVYPEPLYASHAGLTSGRPPRL